MLAESKTLAQSSGSMTLIIALIGSQAQKKTIKFHVQNLKNILALKISVKMA